jgi:hypothetical protein
MRWNFGGLSRSNRHAPIRNLRLEMIEETNRFLTWALSEDRRLPRIPTRAMSKGGFRHIMDLDSGKTLVYKWWHKTLELVDLE